VASLATLSLRARVLPVGLLRRWLRFCKGMVFIFRDSTVVRVRETSCMVSEELVEILVRLNGTEEQFGSMKRLEPVYSPAFVERNFCQPCSYLINLSSQTL
jgi:hypothetical protein